MIKPYKEEKPYNLASLVEMMFQAHARQLPLRGGKSTLSTASRGSPFPSGKASVVAKACHTLFCSKKQDA